MRSIAGLFGKSPFGPLQAHVKKANACVRLLRPLFEAFLDGDKASVARIAEEIGSLEREADEIKNDLRDKLPRSLFLPAARSDLLVLLEVQDTVADSAQDVATLMQIRSLNFPESFRGELLDLVDCTIECSDRVLEIFNRLHDLLEGAFRGKATVDVFEAIKGAGTAEHRADKLALSMMAKLFNLDVIPIQELIIWDKILTNLGKVSDFSNKTASRVRIILAT